MRSVRWDSPPRATLALLRLLADPADDVRNASIDALAALHAEAAFRLRRARPEAPRRPDTARRGQVALGKLATPTSIAALITLTRMPPVSLDTRAALRGAGGAAVPTGARAGGRHARQRRACGRRAGRPRRSARHGTVCAALERHADLAPVALDALARIGDPAAIPTLARAAESSDLETRRRGFAALLALRDPRALVTLPRGLADGDANVRELAARLAGAIGAHSSALALAALLGDGERDVRRAAATALAAVAAPSTALLTTSWPGSRGRALRPATTTNGRRSARRWNGRPSRGTPARLAAAWKTAREPERPALARAIAAGQAGAVHRFGLLCNCRFAGGRRPAGDRGGRGPRGRTDSGGRAASPSRARFADASPDRPRAALRCDRADAGRRVWLAALIRAHDETTEVRAAAAWAARGLDDGDVRDVLDVAARDDAAPVAANARAGACRRGRPRRSTARGWVGGTPAGPRRHAVTGAGCVSFANAGEVWAVTDDAGGVRLFGPPAAALPTLRGECRRRSSPLLERAMTAAIAIGRSPAATPSPRSAASASPARPCT